MFYLSKIAWALFQPSSVVLLLLASGSLFAILGKARPALRLFACGTLLYAVFGFSPIGNWLLATLEVNAHAAAAKNLEGADGIIVLGGAIGQPSPLGDGSPHLNESGDRMVEAVRLAARFPALPVLFSGGKGDLFASDEAATEAELARRFFEWFNIKPPRLKLEDSSRNTLENAVQSARLLRPSPGQKWILVTSAFHMPRAKALFESRGFQILARPVDFKTSGFDGWWRFFLRASDGLGQTDLAAHEWAGLGMAWLMGHITIPKKVLEATLTHPEGAAIFD